MDGKAEHVLFDLGDVGGKRGSRDVDHGVCTQLRGQVPLTIYSAGHRWVVWASRKSCHQAVI